MNYCGATTKSGRRCRQKAMIGQRVCHVHGGRSPQALSAAAGRVATERARRYLAALGGEVPSVTDPIGELERLAGQAVALVDLLRAVVANLEELRYSALGAGQEQVRGELSAYLAALGRAESILGKLAALGLDERRVRVQEAQAAVLVAAVAAVLAHAGLGLDEERQRLGRSLLADELRRRELVALPASGNGGAA